MSDVEQVKAKLNIVDVVSKYIDLKSAGSTYKGLCPFHNEKTPSFNVNPNLQIFKCFGCGKAGDVLTFIQEIERVEFVDALNKAAEWAGVTLSRSVKKDPALEQKKERLYSAHELTAKFYHHILLKHSIGKKGRDYATQRGLTAKELTKFKFGYAPDGYTNLKDFLLKHKFTQEELLEFGLTVERKSTTIDKFRNRLMQPLFDIEGRIIGFSGRFIGKSDYAPKYLNSSESLIFKKNQLLYSLYHSKENIRKSKKVIIVEGNLDVVSSHRVGVENILAPLGTAFTDQQAALLKRYTDEVLFCFDSDNAGINALIRAIEIVEKQGLTHKVIELGDFQDADEVIKKDPKLWEKKVENPLETLQYLKKQLSKDLDLGSVEGKVTMEKRFIPIIKSTQDVVVQKHYAKELSLILEVTPDEIMEKVKNGKKIRPSFLQEEPQQNVEEKKEPVHTNEDFLLALIVQNCIRNKFIPLEITPDYIFTNPVNKEVYEILSEVQEDLPPEILNTLDDLTKKTYANAVITDVGSIGELPLAIKQISVQLAKQNIKSQIMQLRRQLAADSEAEELVTKLTELASIANRL